MVKKEYNRLVSPSDVDTKQPVVNMMAGLQQRGKDECSCDPIKIE